MKVKISEQFPDIKSVASYLRAKDKKRILIFAHNGTGKTRLSMEFKNQGRNKEEGTRDSLYYNAFTEDLFRWNNDLDNDKERYLNFNIESNFFVGLKELEIETRIRSNLKGYDKFDFRINHEEGKIIFNRQELVDGTMQQIDNIKISRGEENIFIWCFFLTIAELAIDKQEAYSWVKNIYIDDPISSLDDNKAIAVACHIGQLIDKDNKNKEENNKIKIIISTHHGLFFNSMHNILNNNALKFYFNKDRQDNVYKLRDTNDTPFFHHIASFIELEKAALSGDLYSYHFNMLRNLLEKTAAFHGFNKFSDCIKKWDDDPEEIVYSRMINIMSHGNYSLFEPVEMADDNKEYFKRILKDLTDSYPFNKKLYEN